MQNKRFDNEVKIIFLTSYFFLHLKSSLSKECGELSSSLNFQLLAYLTESNSQADIFVISSSTLGDIRVPLKVACPKPSACPISCFATCSKVCLSNVKPYDFFEIEIST